MKWPRLWSVPVFKKYGDAVRIGSTGTRMGAVAGRDQANGIGEAGAVRIARRALFRLPVIPSDVSLQKRIVFLLDSEALLELNRAERLGLPITRIAHDASEYWVVNLLESETFRGPARYSTVVIRSDSGK